MVGNNVFGTTDGDDEFGTAVGGAEGSTEGEDDEGMLGYAEGI